MKSKTCEMACEILQQTNDGDQLAPEHLKLVELAVNGLLNEIGDHDFMELYKAVTDGRYKMPWLHGVEHMTRDHEGYIYWKGQHIDHWSGDLPHSQKGSELAVELARRCQVIESRGETPSVSNVCWKWEE